MLDFIWYVALAGIGITLMTGRWGCFIALGRWSYLVTYYRTRLLCRRRQRPALHCGAGVSVLIAPLLNGTEHVLDVCR